MFVKLCEGNPGALGVLMRIWKEGQAIDPYTDPLLLILMFDSFGIYGSDIWILYKDVCGQKLNKTIALIRAAQLGIITAEKLRAEVNQRGSNRGTGATPQPLDVEGVCLLVKQRLPNFDLDVPKPEGVQDNTSPVQP